MIACFINTFDCLLQTVFVFFIGKGTFSYFLNLRYASYAKYSVLIMVVLSKSHHKFERNWLGCAIMFPNFIICMKL